MHRTHAHIAQEAKFSVPISDRTSPQGGHSTYPAGGASQQQVRTPTTMTTSFGGGGVITKVDHAPDRRPSSGTMLLSVNTDR